MNTMEDIRKTLNQARRMLSPKIMVKHMCGTSEYEPIQYTTWKEYWLKESELRGTYKSFPQQKELCPCCGKNTNPEDFVGGHIETVAEPKKQYITLVCRECNSTYGKGKQPSPEFAVKEYDCVEFQMSKSRIRKP